DACAGSGRIPGPDGLFHVAGDLNRLAPGSAVVGALRDPNSAAAFARAVDDHGLGVAAQVVRHQKPNDAGLPIDDGTWVAAGVGTVVPNDLRAAPGFAAVVAAFDEKIDVAGVAAAVLASLAESEQDAVLRGDERRNAVGV